MKTEVYSWRVSQELKMSLEREARRRKISVSAVLDMAAEEWLKKSAANNGDDEREQKRLHAAAAKTIGTIKGGNPLRAENAREIVRQIIRERHGR
jgi:hypothetical protein